MSSAMNMPEYTSAPISRSAWEKKCPQVSRGTAHRCGHTATISLCGHRGDLIPAQGVGPDVGLVHPEERGHGEPVPAVRDPARGDPPLDGLGVDLHGISELVEGLPALEQQRSQPFVPHVTGPAGRERTASP